MPQKKPKKILVTGGAGFIGSHIVDMYINDGHRVSIIDDFSTGSKRNVNKRAVVYRGNISKRKFVRDVLAKERPDTINHHAAIVSLTKAIEHPEKLYDANVTGTYNLLLAAKEAGVKRFLYASSCSVLGDPKKIPADESSPLDPPSPYAYSKLASEKMIAFYAPWFGMRYIIFRYPNIYGPRQNHNVGGIVPIFVNILQSKKSITIYGDGSKTRDYLFVEDIARASTLALTKGKNTTVHLGWGQEVSDQTMFDEIQAALGTSSKPIYAAFRPWEIRKISLSNKRAEEILGWKPRVTLREGIEKTLRAL